MNWTFLHRAAVEAMHDEQLHRHGGARGLRDGNALESALGSAANKAAYGEPDVFELAAAYLYGIARNRPFADGNKRTAFVASGAFLLTNGFASAADDGHVYEFVRAVAAGEIAETGAAMFFRDFCQPV